MTDFLPWDTATSLKIELAQYEDNAFVLGSSLLGGTDVLSNQGLEWVSIADSVQSVSISRGMSRDSIWRRIETGTCSISMVTQDFDPWVNSSIRVGATVRVQALRVALTSRRNQIYNPSFETDLTNWSSYNSASLARVSTASVWGSYCLQITTASNNAGAQSSLSPINDLPIVVTASDIWGSAYVKADAGVSMRLRTRVYNSFGTEIDSRSVVFTGTGSFERQYVTVPANVNAVSATVEVLTNQTSAGVVFVDAVMIEQSSVNHTVTSLGDYFDGNFTDYVGPDTTNYTYGWFGTENASFSYENALPVTLFTGTIDSLSSSYDKSGWTNVSLTLSDATKKLLNTRAADYLTVGTTDTATNVINAMGSAAGLTAAIGNGEGEVAVLGLFDELEPIAGDLINTAIDAEYGWFWIAKSNTEFVYLGRNYPTTIAPSYTLHSSDSESLTEFPIREIDVDLSVDQIANAIKVTSSFDAGADPITIRDQDSIDLYGEVSEDVSVYLDTGATGTDLTQLTAWATNVPVKRVSRRVNSVTVSSLTSDNFINAVADFAPATQVNVFFDQPGRFTIDDDYLVTMVHHEITLDQWLTTVELWKD